MNIHPGENTAVSLDENGAMVSIKETTPVSLPPVAPQTTNPYTSFGFWSYGVGPDVVVSRGFLKVTAPAAGGGTWSYLDSGIAEATVTGLTAGVSGYIIFAYGQTAGDDGPASTASDSNVDFGDPAGNYIVTERVGMEATTRESNVVNGNRYGYVFSLTPPAPSNTVFQAVICRVSVSETGIAIVYPVHFGDLDVPLGYVGKTTNLTAVRIA